MTLLLLTISFIIYYITIDRIGQRINKKISFYTFKKNSKLQNPFVDYSFILCYTKLCIFIITTNIYRLSTRQEIRYISTKIFYRRKNP